MTLQELQDEVGAIQAIYPESLIQEDTQTYTLTIPEHPKLKIQLAFPDAYPDESPQVVDVISQDNRRYTDINYLEESIKKATESTFNPGMVCLFDLISELEDMLQKYQSVVDTSPAPKESTPPKFETTLTIIASDKAQHNPREGWIISESILDRGSTFIAFARAVTSVEQAKKYVDVLLSDKKLARATHSITSWRIRREDGIQFQDCDDDGETAAGSRLLHLLTMMDAWNVVVVVSRWFGGTHLGPDRFKHINSAARDAVTKGNFVLSKKNNKN